MEHRELGRTGYRVSELGFGAWAIGGTWGNVNDDDSMAALRRAVDLGVDFFDTADVYGDGRSERLLGKLRREVKTPIVIATKAGRRVPKHTADSYTKPMLTSAVERSLENLGVETLDLLQLHAPPTPVYYRPEVFGALDDLVHAGKIRYYGVSVEKVEEGLKSLEYPGVQSVQIIFNLFRQRPSGLFFAEAARHKVGVLARLPLSSGMLTGKMSKGTSFEADDHRTFNRDGKAFDRGETFSGVDYELGLSVVEELKALVPPGMTLSELALRYILDFPAVSSVIPGAKNPQQVEQNVRPASLPPLGPELHARLAELYRTRLAEHVHQRW
jgi:aryl-alcohol dehydrogenase-like predicted oxidoreductase